MPMPMAWRTRRRAWRRSCGSCRRRRRCPGQPGPSPAMAGAPRTTTTTSRSNTTRRRKRTTTTGRCGRSTPAGSST
uniref:Uncharacterized protein n=1 Tax=Arundo donax TaxID=35708 RepID=A0A0A9HCU4_ARUDO